MIEARPSRTALLVAMRRAAHQIFDKPQVFEDPLALSVISPEAGAKLRDEQGKFGSRIGRSIRAFMATRSRLAEDELARAIARGARQYVILGAGLDTFAYRNPYSELGLRVFEVDHPATQAWKHKRLAAARIAIPPSLTYVPVDFEHQTLPEGLRQAGFDSTKAAFFSWLGVTFYLERETVMGTFRFIASCASGGGVAFDYGVPRTSVSWFERLALAALSRRVAKAGEPFRAFFDSTSLATELEAMGFSSVEDLGKEEINARYFNGRADGLRVGSGLAHLMSAER